MFVSCRSQEERESTWLKNRADDPALSPKGEREAQQLGQWLQKEVKKGRACRVYTSPFLRTLQTTRGLATGLENPTIICHPNIFETGGVYTQVASGERAGERTGPGKCLTAADIQATYGYGTDMLPSEGQWYRGGWEADAESRSRAIATAAWLKSPEFRAEVGTNLVLFVM